MDANGETNESTETSNAIKPPFERRCQAKPDGGLVSDAVRRLRLRIGEGGHRNPPTPSCPSHRTALRLYGVPPAPAAPSQASGSLLSPSGILVGPTRRTQSIYNVLRIFSGTFRSCRGAKGLSGRLLKTFGCVIQKIGSKCGCPEVILPCCIVPPRVLYSL